MKKSEASNVKEKKNENNRGMLLARVVTCTFLATVVIAIAIIAKTITNANGKEEVAKADKLLLRAEFDPSGLQPTEHANIETDTVGTKVPVPKGYVGSPLTEGFTHPSGVIISDGGERTVNTGFVIYEKLEGESDSDAKAAIAADPWTAQTTRNQYVWVPVPDASKIYGTDENGKKWGKLYIFSATNTSNITGTTAASWWTETNGVMKITYISHINYSKEPYIDAAKISNRALNNAKNLGVRTQQQFLTQMEREFNQMVVSVEKYGGFYIGRYETGGLNATAKVVKMDTNISISRSTEPYIQMYIKSKKLKSTNSHITTGMLWECLWNRTLMWLIESGNKTKAQVSSNSVDWGNYDNNAISYINASGTQLNANGRTRIPAGSSESTRANNIYDLAGNVSECVMTWLRVGGEYQSVTGKRYATYTTSAGFMDGAEGSRAALYIK